MNIIFTPSKYSTGNLRSRRRGWRLLWTQVSLVFLFVASCCQGSQSMFTPAGAEAERVLILFWIMLIGSVVIFALVVLLTIFACRGSQRWRNGLRAEKTVIRLGLIFPVVLLTVLLGWGFWLLGKSGAGAQDADLIIRVEGEQWWWRVIYSTEDGTAVESANEVRVPVGALVELQLTSADVLHSFWLPSWAGKMDMVPGRTNVLRFRVDSPGIVRGQCAEYCGGAHALMALYGVAMPPDEFSRWLELEAAPASAGTELPGHEIFLQTGCGACHRVRGESSPGGMGPDLTHVGSRLSIGAGILDNNIDTLSRWLERHKELKPGNRMPAFAFLSERERMALSEYLKALE